MAVTLADITAARQRIASGIYNSPCPESIPLSELCGMQLYCKLDYLQRTGSFKERGARNALLQLPKPQQQHGVVAASAGNHALGLAYHGKLLGIPTTVVMPRFAPLVKITTCRRLQANVILHGETYAEARELAEQMAVEKNLAYIHGFDDPHVIAGQGTMGLEILEQVPDLDAVIVPVGGAGLLAGVAVAIKAQKSSVKVMGVESLRAASFTAAMAAGRPVEVPVKPSLADGLAVGRVGALAFATAAPLVSKVVTVTEEELSLSVLRLLELEKSVVEGAAAASLAACIGDRFPELSGKKVVLLLCGGNIDPTILSRVIEKGLVDDGRLFRFTAVVSDRPGGLAHLTRLIAESGASIKEITHDRAFSGPDITATNVLCTVETADAGHIERLVHALEEAGVVILPGEEKREL